MNFLVTGATGLVGNNVVRQLLDRGHRVRVFTRHSSDSKPLEQLEVDVHHGCISDPQAVRKAIDGNDVVIHAAANLHIGWMNLPHIRKVNVEGTGNVAKAARLAGAKMVHVSTVDALAAGSEDRLVDEETPIQSKLDCTYVVTKREAEEVVQREMESGLDAIIANPGFMLGPWDWKPSSGRMLLAVAKTFAPLAPSGGMSVCDIRDVTSALITMAETSTTQRRYILAGHNVTYLNAWRNFAKLTGGRPPLKAMSPIVRKTVGFVGDVLSKLRGKEGDINSAMLNMSSKYHYYDSVRAKTELGYRVRSMEESITDAWKWFKEHGYA